MDRTWVMACSPMASASSSSRVLHRTSALAASTATQTFRCSTATALPAYPRPWTTTTPVGRAPATAGTRTCRASTGHLLWCERWTTQLMGKACASTTSNLPAPSRSHLATSALTATAGTTTAIKGSRTTSITRTPPTQIRPRATRRRVPQDLRMLARLPSGISTTNPLGSSLSSRAKICAPIYASRTYRAATRRRS